MVELRAAPSPGELRDALARALHDPSVEVAYWVPEYTSFVDADGRPLELPDGQGGRSITRVEQGGRMVAAIVHDESLRDEPELVAAVTAAAGIALENERLQADLRARLEELRGSRARIVEAGDAERRRLEQPPRRCTAASRGGLGRPQPHGRTCRAGLRGGEDSHQYARRARSRRRGVARPGARNPPGRPDRPRARGRAGNPDRARVGPGQPAGRSGGALAGSSGGRRLLPGG